MSNLFFSFDLTPSLLAEKPLPDKAALNDHTTQAAIFEALLREQLSEEQPGGLNGISAESPNEALITTISASDAPNQGIDAPVENTARVPVLPQALETAQAANLEPIENELAGDDVADVPDTLSSTPLLPRESANEAAEPVRSAIQATPQLEANAETAMFQAPHHTWHFDHQQPRETTAVSAETSPNKESTVQRNPSFTTVRDVVGDLPNNPQHNALEQVTTTPSNTQITEASAVPPHNQTPSAAPPSQAPEPAGARAPTDTLWSASPPISPAAARPAERASSESLPARAREQVINTPLEQAGNLNVAPTEHLPNEALTDLNVEPVEAAFAADQGNDKAQRDFAPVLPSSAPVQTNPIIVPPTLEAPSPVTTEVASQAPGSDLHPNPLHKGLPAQPTASAATISAVDAPVNKASRTANRVRPEPARPDNLAPALDLGQTAALANAAEHGRVERAERTQQPTFVTPAKPVFFTSVQTTFEQLATAPESTFAPLAAAVVDKVFVEVAPVLASPIKAPDFTENFLETPTLYKQPHASVPLTQSDLLPAQAWQPDSADSSVRASLHPAAATNLRTDFPLPLSPIALPVQEATVAATTVKVANQIPATISSPPATASAITESTSNVPLAPTTAPQAAAVQATTKEFHEHHQGALRLHEPSPANAQAASAPVTQPNSVAATAQVEIPNLPSNLGEVVHTVLKNDHPNDHPFKLPAPQNTLSDVHIAKPELAVPQVQQPVTVVKSVTQVPSWAVKTSVITPPAQTEPTQFSTQTTFQPTTLQPSLQIPATTSFTLDAAPIIAQPTRRVQPTQSVVPHSVEAGATQPPASADAPHPLIANELTAVIEESGSATKPALTEPAVPAFEKESLTEPVRGNEIVRPIPFQEEIESDPIGDAPSQEPRLEALSLKDRGTDTDRIPQNQPAEVLTAPDTEASTQTMATAPTPRLAEANQVSAKPAHLPATPTGPARAKTQAEVPNRPLTVGQVVRTVLKNDHPFVQPTTLSAPATHAKPELVVPQATPVTVESVVPAAAPTATQLAAPPGLPTTAPAQPAVTNNQFAAEPKPTVSLEAEPQMTPALPALPSLEHEQTETAESKPQMNAATAPVTTTESLPTKVIKRLDHNALPAALASTEAETEPVIAKTSAAEFVATEKIIPSTLPNTPSAATPSGIATKLNHNSAEQRPALPTVDEGLGDIHHAPVVTATAERSSRPGQRTFQLVLQLPSTASNQVQHAFEHELSNPVAVAKRPTLHAAEQPLTPLPPIPAPVGDSTAPIESAQPNTRAPRIQTLSEALPETLVEAVQRTQVPPPADHYEAAPYEDAPSSPALPLRWPATEPLRATFSAIERHFAKVVSASPDSANASPQPPAQVVNNAPVLSAQITAAGQADTPRELVLAPSLRADLAAHDAMPTTTSVPGVNTHATITRVSLPPTPTVSAAGTLDLTDEWLGERQITDPQVSSTKAASVGTLTPAAATDPQNATPEVTPQPESASAATYFSTDLTPAAWATNIVTEPLPAVWNAPKPSVHSAGAARWTAALNHAAGPAARSTAHSAGKADFPWLGINTPSAEPTTLADKAPKPERPNLPTADASVAPPVLTSSEVNIETTPAKPLERVISPPPGLLGKTALPGVTGELALPRVALEHERAVERPLPESSAKRAVRTGVDSALPGIAPQATPINNGAEFDLPPAALNAVGEDKEELAVKSLDPSAPSLPERGPELGLARGIAVAQDTDTRDANVSHVARQLAEPLLTASAALAPNEPRTIRLKLRPETLGEVEIVLTRDTSGQYHAHLSAEREQTTHVLRGQLGQLREALEQAGLQVGQLDITTSPEAHSQGSQGWHAGGQDAQRTRQPLAHIPEAESFDSESAAHGGPTTAQDRLINLHA